MNSTQSLKVKSMDGPGVNSTQSFKVKSMDGQV